MKKYFNFIVAVLLAASMSVGFVACKDDNNEPSIEGVWKYTEETPYDTFTRTFTLKSDGTGLIQDKTMPIGGSVSESETVINKWFLMPDYNLIVETKDGAIVYYYSFEKDILILGQAVYIRQ